MNQAQLRTAEGILFTDMYQLTMAQLYFRAGLHERRAQFDHFFRRYPDYGEHKAGYCITAGMGSLVDWMKEARFREEDLDYLRSEVDRDGRRVFGDDFLEWLRRSGNFEGLTIHAIPEGRVVHAEVPGVSKDDIHVAIDGNVVTLRAEVKQADSQTSDEKVLRSERYYGAVARSFQLASDIDQANARAKYENGVLRLTLPKKSASGAQRLAIE